MSRLLYRLARYCAAKRSVVIGVWVAIFLGLGVVAFTGMEVAEGDFSIPGTESSEALESLEDLFPGSDEETGSVQLVFHAESGSITDPVAIGAIESSVNSVRSLANVLDVSDPLATVSADGTLAVVEVTIADLGSDTSLIDELNRGLESAVEPVQASGVTVEIGGSLAETEAGLSISELLGAVVAFVVLVLTFGSLAAAGANMVSALAGVVVGVTGILAWSAISPIEDSTLILSLMLGLAVGIDYSLFILSRFRDELRAGRSVSDAVPTAIGTAGSAVVFAGLTVVIALAGLTIVNIPPITEMGLAAAGIVAIAVVLSLTIMPVLLRTLGHQALPRRERSIPSVHRSSGRIGFFEQWANVITSFPKQALIATVALLLVVCIPFFAMETALGVPGGSVPESSERRAYDLIADSFGDGFQSPLVVLVESPDAATSATGVASTIAGLDHVAGVSDPQPNADNSAAILQVFSTDGPNDSETSDLVKDIRATTGTSDSATIRVTGQTAVDIDINEKMSDALILYVFLIVGLAMILLIVLFRSILVPVIAAAGFLMSLGASLGMTVAIFQWGWLGAVFGVDEGRPLMSIFPIIIVGILFGLAMDYQVFLVSRIHEANVRGLSNRDAILDGFSRSANVVVAAATIMMAVFAGFALSGSDLVASLAFALAAGVLVDAFLVRMIFVPAMLMLVGTKSWWIPAWLDRILPTIDTEGRTLVGAPDSGTLAAPAMGAAADD